MRNALRILDVFHVLGSVREEQGTFYDVNPILFALAPPLHHDHIFVDDGEYVVTLGAPTVLAEVLAERRAGGDPFGEGPEFFVNHLNTSPR